MSVSEITDSIEQVSINEPAVDLKETVESVPSTESEEKKKKKKKKNNKKKPAFKDPIHKHYPSGRYPEGEWLDYTGDENIHRSTSAELRELDNKSFQKWNDYRKGAEIHRRVRAMVQSNIQPGMTTTEVAEMIENTVRDMTASTDSKVTGMGFPVGLSLNHVAAHYTPNAGDTTIIKKEDVLKIDFGVHVNGHIVDCAWTQTFDDRYDSLLNAVRAATNEGIKVAGIDVRLTDIGEAIEEVMESHEIELDGKVYPIKCIRNLCGHNILPYKIHGGKSIPIVKNGDNTKLEEGEVIAIETFGSTGKGYIIQQGECSHYSRNDTTTTPKLSKAKELLATIDKNFGTIPFCRRYLDRVGEDKYLFALNNLVKEGIVTEHPPLVDIKGCYTAQFEHTVLLHPHRKEVVSRGDDY